MESGLLGENISELLYHLEQTELRPHDFWMI